VITLTNQQTVIGFVMNQATLNRLLLAPTNYFADLNLRGDSYSNFAGKYEDVAKWLADTGAQVVYEGEPGAAWEGGTLMIAIKGKD
jgi:hypothetical protein